MFSPSKERYALALAEALWKDGALDEAETDLLDELTHESTPPGLVVISGEGAAATLTRPTASGGTLLFLHWAKIPMQMRTKGWEKDLGPFVVYANGSPENEKQVFAFLTLDLARAYVSSNAVTYFRPFKLRIQAMEERANALPPESVGSAKALIYKAAEQLDRLESGLLQDFLYKYLQPKADQVNVVPSCSRGNPALP